GMIEVASFSRAIEILDACLKAADVVLVNYEANFGSVIIKIEGDVAAVKASVESGKETAARFGDIISAHVIPQPDSDVDKVVDGSGYMGDRYPPVSAKGQGKVKAEVKTSTPETDSGNNEKTVKRQNKTDKQKKDDTDKSIRRIIRKSKEKEDVTDNDKKEKEKSDISNSGKPDEKTENADNSKNHAKAVARIREEEIKKMSKEEQPEKTDNKTNETVSEKAPENTVDKTAQPEKTEKTESSAKPVKTDEPAEKPVKKRDCNYICALCDDMDCPERRE
ncbi:MAG: BMC domain-containing protein, partial [Candidatus Muiribacteriaceae bacterium]